jgi:hypothetical protein
VHGVIHNARTGLSLIYSNAWGGRWKERRFLRAIVRIKWSVHSPNQEAFLLGLHGGKETDETHSVMYYSQSG